jgi:hypothetical protein
MPPIVLPVGLPSGPRAEPDSEGLDTMIGSQVARFLVIAGTPSPEIMSRQGSMGRSLEALRKRQTAAEGSSYARPIARRAD